ncbi:hypothetical protein ACYX34_13890 [Nitrospira sp. CMX1]
MPRPHRYKAVLSHVVLTSGFRRAPLAARWSANRCYAAFPLLPERRINTLEEVFEIMARLVTAGYRRLQ